MDELLHEMTIETEKRKKAAAEAGTDIRCTDLSIFSEEEISGYVRRYDEILKLAEEEYPKKPELYVDGYNTANRLRKQKESVLFFLDHPWVPWHNNDSEQGARTVWFY